MVWCATPATHFFGHIWAYSSYVCQLQCSKFKPYEINSDFRPNVEIIQKLRFFIYSFNFIVHETDVQYVGWLRGTVVELERRSLAGELSLCCARPVADG